jgi:hypothetical protein
MLRDHVAGGNGNGSACTGAASRGSSSVFGLTRPFQRWRTASIGLSSRRKSGPKVKNQPKTVLKKIVKLTVEHTCACMMRQNLNMELHPMTGNGCYVKLHKLEWKNS